MLNAKPPPISISSLDLERLERLLDSPAASTTERTQLDRLLRELERAEVLEPQQVPATLVTMNSTVRCREQASGREYQLTLVYPHDLDGHSDKVSVLAPLGSALLGLSVGQAIDWPAPGGQQLRIEVLELLFQPEAAGHYHR